MDFCLIYASCGGPVFPWITLGPVTLPTFFVINSIIASLAFVWIISRAEVSKSDIRFVADLTLILMASGLIGARLFHVLYENFAFYKAHPFNIFFLWEGGFVFYGGFLFAFLCGVLFCRYSNQNPIEYVDLFAPVLSLSYALGRIGCLLNGCCYGKVCEFPWAIAGRHPTQIYSTVLELGILFVLLRLEKNKNRRPSFIFATWMLLHSAGRFIIEFLRDDFRGPTAWLSISSWISLLLFISSLAWLTLAPRLHSFFRKGE